MKKRKIIPALRAAVVAVSLTGCSGSLGPAAEKGADTQAPKAEAGAEAGKDEAVGVKKGEGGSGPADEKLIIYDPLTESMTDSMLIVFEEGTDTGAGCPATGTGDAPKRIQTEADDPQADILWSGTIGTMKNKSECFADCVTSNEGALYDEYKNTKGNLARSDTIPSVTMVNTDLIGDIKIEEYEDPLNPELKSKIAFVDPAASSSSLERLVNTLYTIDGGTPNNDWDYVEQFCTQLNDKLLGGSSAVYKGVAGEEYTIGLTFEQGPAQYMDAGAPVKTVHIGEGVIFRGDEVYVIESCLNEFNARKLVDWLISKDIQEFINNAQYRRTIHKDVEAGDAMTPMDQIEVIQDGETDAATYKPEWLDEFKELFIE